MLKKNIFPLLLIIMQIPVSLAGVQIGGSRLIYDGNAKQASISVNNPDKQPYLIQSWVNKSVESNTDDGVFISTPPLFRLDPNTQNSIRIIYNGQSLPKDRESVYWLNIKSIPSSDKEAQNVLLIAVKSKMKLFYRPTGLKENPANAYKQLKFSQSNGKLLVKNPTPYHVSFYSLKVNGKDIENPEMVAPFSTKVINKSVATGNNVNWQAINDFGGVTPTEQQIIPAP